MKPPKLKRDWKGHYLISRYVLINGRAYAPAGTVFRVRDNSRILSLETLPCPCCHVRHFFTLKGRDRETYFDYLGPEPPRQA